ncbi:MAG: GGDEF domain-containing protein [Thermincolia bacterium]
MSDMQRVDRNLWIITGAASFPFVILAFTDMVNVVQPHLFILTAFSGLFNGLFVPFYLMKRQVNWLKKTLALGVNILIAALWISYTGSTESIFYPSFFFLPIVAATMHGGFVDALVTALISTILTLGFHYREVGLGPEILQDKGLLVNIVLFFLVALVVGYLIKVHREQHSRNLRVNDELETAYNQLSASHEQLQCYTGIIKKMNKDMERLAITDELTMLYNYRYFQLTLEKEVKGNKYSCLSLIMLDIDHFKKYNDKFGHAMGNRILAEIARIMKDSVRDADTVVRYGGEEFAVVLPSTDTDEAAYVAERIRYVVENFTFSCSDGTPTKVTVSMGIACFPKDSRNKSELISHADLALYRAKQTGRNKVCIYEDDNGEVML